MSGADFVNLSTAAEHVPLGMDADGVIRVGGTRVTLDTVISAFLGGSSPVEIAHQYAVLNLADVYAVITFYLRRQAEVDAYLEQGQRETQAAAQEFAAMRPAPGLRERLLARRVR